MNIMRKENIDLSTCLKIHYNISDTQLCLSDIKVISELCQYFNTNNIISAVTQLLEINRSIYYINAFCEYDMKCIINELNVGKYIIKHSISDGDMIVTDVANIRRKKIGLPLKEYTLIEKETIDKERRLREQHEH